MAGNDLGSLLGSLLGGGSQGGGSGNAGNILGALLGTLDGNPGGGGGGGANALEGLIGMLTKSGLLDQAQSWVGAGENKPVSGAQIAQALPDETLQKVAQHAGVSTEQAADGIARSLPEAVDKLTPAGEVPKGGSIEDLIRAQAL
ncbi:MULTISPECIES: YidB family protein [unclassified Streptomyces]|uniref:YidB family protein n=1 Tax=unclassified Streptomyces TaxID=2593676 RepID=UPI002E80BE6B|nr:YidB family protein [Streptomyces sp. NBC_00562]WTC82759.1 YidB family protein [Streptomyces sp. NBC_01653]WTD88107.1 YidB family protein [Streptomyces sp. NBC_01637]WUC19136.1 YidB family protein [Streptomyces sp. NBC_00562]